MSAQDTAPPGREKQVKALKEQPGVESPYAVAWASYNKSHDAIDIEGYDGAAPDFGEHADTIRKSGGKFVLVARSTGKVLGTHETREGAEAQERAVQANKHTDGAARVQRFDRGELRPATKRENGWLEVEGMTAKCGILDYEDGAGNVRKELVLPEELGAPDSMASARMVPVTSPHPQALLDDKTTRAHQVGQVGEDIRMVGDHLAAPLLITDGDTVRSVEVGGRRQLSWGYDCRLDPPDPSLYTTWGRHDGIQRDRRYNHLAIVDEARAGATARLRLDSTARCMVDVSASHELAQEPTMSQIQIGTIRIDAKPESAAMIQQAIDREIGDLQKRLDAVTAEKTATATARDAQSKRADGILARGKAKLGRIRTLLDGMKSRMVACDECGGSGKVMDGEQEQKCGYCDGAGKFRAHDAIKTMGDESGGPDDDMEEMGEEMKDDDLSRESAAEEGLERAANEEHKDRAAKRRDARKAARARRDAAFARMVDRRAASRAALLSTAGKYLGEEKMDGKPDVEVKRAVLVKIASHLDAAKLDPGQVDLFYAAEMKRADASGETLTASDQMRAGMNYVPPVAQRRDSGEDKARAAADAKANAYQKPMEQPKVASK